MRPARHLSSVAVPVLVAVALLAACAPHDAAPSPNRSPTQESTAGFAAAPPATPASQAAADATPGSTVGADACGGDACGADPIDDTARAPALRRVASDQVCMRTNRFMGKAQPSTDVEGRAYFGCCAGCTRHLGEHAAARTAKDPVTGQTVDKAAAVIGARPDGTVVYFASEETFARAGGA